MQYICPKCFNKGAHPEELPSPKCHFCSYKVAMVPLNRSIKAGLEPNAFEDASRALAEWLHYDGIAFFTMCKEAHGTLLPIWEVAIDSFPYRIPHSVHFGAGMSVRNFLRHIPSINFFEQDVVGNLDDYYEEFIARALKICEDAQWR